MKRLSTFFAAGTLALTLSTSAMAGPVGVASNHTATTPDATTITELHNASETAMTEGREGNKSNPAFARKSYVDERLIARLESGRQVNQKQIDKALQPVWVW
jgi:hypothetical protein